MALSYNTKDTIVALASSAGAGAIAVIRLSGERTFEISKKIFSLNNNSKKNISDFQSHTVHLGNIYDDEKIIDEVLLTVSRSPNSYTAEDVVEISCHGSRFIQQKIIQLTTFKAGINKSVHPHTLSHSMATHLLDD